MHIETNVLHDGDAPEDRTGATVFPVYQSTAFAYESAEQIESVFAGRAPGFVYSRIGNPTLDRFERRMTALENGISSISCASGMAAISTTVLALAQAGDEIVSGNSIFGGTYSLLAHTLPRYGITTRFVETTDPDAYRNAITDRTRLIFVETIGNPKLDVPDIAAVAAIAKAHGLILVVDNTVTTPVLCRPRDLGANIVIHSTSKFINGHGNAVGGVIVDCGTFDWDSPRYPAIRAFHNRFGEFAFAAALRRQIHRDLGACASPFNTFLMGIGMDSLAVRMERHCANAARLAECLASDPRMDAVRYPGLPAHPDRATAQRQFVSGFGALMTIKLGTRERCFRFINALRRIRNLANLGDVRTRVIHPASTFCRDADDRERAAMGVTDDLVRLSIGIEHVEDILEDIDQALGR
jgi:O-acetylhomoserine (thiol)-lyase